MDDQFYRKLQPEKLLKKIGRNAAKNKRRTVLILLGIVLFFYFLLDNKGLITRMKLERQQKEWNEQLQRDSLETKRLQERIRALETNSDTLEQVARERYGLAKEGETVYQVKK
jgi:cell division protein FtsB